MVGCGSVAVGWSVCGRVAGGGFPPRALAGVPTFLGCFRPIVGGFPANAQAGKLQEEASKRCSGNQTITTIANSWGSLQDGQKLRTLNASLLEPQLTLKTMTETNPEETSDRTPGLR